MDSNFSRGVFEWVLSNESYNNQDNKIIISATLLALAADTKWLLEKLAELVGPAKRNQ